MIVAGVWTGVGFSNLKNCLTRIRTRIPKFWNRSGVRVWQRDSGNIWSLTEVGPDPDYRSQLRQDSEFFFGPGSRPGDKNLGKTGPGPGVKCNFWLLRNFWPVIVFQLFRFSE